MTSPKRIQRKLKRGTFEMAFVDGYQKYKCWLYGPIAIHRPSQANWYDYKWKISHVGTGLAIPNAYANRLVDAEKFARSLARAIDWTTIRRTTHAWNIRGMTEAKADKIRAVTRRFAAKREGKK